MATQHKQNTKTATLLLSYWFAPPAFQCLFNLDRSTAALVDTPMTGVWCLVSGLAWPVGNQHSVEAICEMPHYHWRSLPQFRGCSDNKFVATKFTGRGLVGCVVALRIIIIQRFRKTPWSRRTCGEKVATSLSAILYHPPPSCKPLHQTARYAPADQRNS